MSLLLCAFVCVVCVCCFFKQKTAYEMRISDWSSDVCSSDLVDLHQVGGCHLLIHQPERVDQEMPFCARHPRRDMGIDQVVHAEHAEYPVDRGEFFADLAFLGRAGRSEEHTSELQSLMRISYAVFCLKKKNTLNFRSQI